MMQPAGWHWYICDLTPASATKNMALKISYIDKLQENSALSG